VSQTVLVIGAGSGIGRAMLHELAAEGQRLIIAGRRTDEMERLAADCRIRFGVEAAAEHFDALELSDHEDFVARSAAHFDGGLDGVVLCYGEMTDEAEAQRDAELARRMIDVNHTSAVSVLEVTARYMVPRGRGWICAFGSVAGDRGRPSNAIYGSTKAALSTYLSGLRVRLSHHGIAVVTVKPGVVDTGMTWALPALPLVVAPDRVARDALRGVRRNRAVVYSPWFWAIIMTLIRAIPDRIFKKLDL